MAEKKKNFIVTVNESWCKRCGICIAYCPVNLFDEDRGLPIVRDNALCIGCLKCELMCPDFAITVTLNKEK